MKESKEILIPSLGGGGESFTGKHSSYQDLKARINIALKAYYKWVVMKTMRYWHKKEHIDQWKKLESPHINDYICG